MKLKKLSCLCGLLIAGTVCGANAYSQSQSLKIQPPSQNSYSVNLVTPNDMKNLDSVSNPLPALFVGGKSYWLDQVNVTKNGSAIDLSKASNMTNVHVTIESSLGGQSSCTMQLSSSNSQAKTYSLYNCQVTLPGMTVDILAFPKNALGQNLGNEYLDNVNDFLPLVVQSNGDSAYQSKLNEKSKVKLVGARDSGQSMILAFFVTQTGEEDLGGASITPTVSYYSNKKAVAESQGAESIQLLPKPSYDSLPLLQQESGNASQNNSANQSGDVGSSLSGTNPFSYSIDGGYINNYSGYDGNTYLKSLVEYQDISFFSSELSMLVPSQVNGTLWELGNLSSAQNIIGDISGSTSQTPITVVSPIKTGFAIKIATNEVNQTLASKMNQKPSDGYYDVSDSNPFFTAMDGYYNHEFTGVDHSYWTIFDFSVKQKANAFWNDSIFASLYFLNPNDLSFQSSESVAGSESSPSVYYAYKNGKQMQIPTPLSGSDAIGSKVLSIPFPFKKSYLNDDNSGLATANPSFILGYIADMGVQLDGYLSAQIVDYKPHWVSNGSSWFAQDPKNSECEPFVGQTIEDEDGNSPQVDWLAQSVHQVPDDYAYFKKWGYTNAVNYIYDCGARYDQAAGANLYDFEDSQRYQDPSLRRAGGTGLRFFITGYDQYGNSFSFPYVVKSYKWDKKGLETCIAEGENGTGTEYCGQG